jgi:hypothetical protein
VSWRRHNTPMISYNDYTTEKLPIDLFCSSNASNIFSTDKF